MPNTERNNLILEGLKQYPAVLDPDQVADIIGVSRRTMDELIKGGTVKAFALDPTKYRKQYRINKADLIAYLTASIINLK
jgi:excisionase family DNA binding protein